MSTTSLILCLPAWMQLLVFIFFFHECNAIISDITEGPDIMLSRLCYWALCHLLVGCWWEDRKETEERDPSWKPVFVQALALQCTLGNAPSHRRHHPSDLFLHPKLAYTRRIMQRGGDETMSCRAASQWLFSRQNLNTFYQWIYISSIYRLTVIETSVEQKRERKRLYEFLKKQSTLNRRGMRRWEGGEEQRGAGERNGE